MYLLIGFLGGVISGMGMGGGTLLIPLLTIFLGVSQRSAQGANLIAYLPAASIALFTHRKSGRLDIGTAKPFVMWGFLGAIVGTLLALITDNFWLRKGFAVFIIAMGVWQFWQGELRYKEECKRCR